MFIYRQMHSSVDAMRKILILCFGLGLTILASAGERAALWPEGKTPDFQPQQIAATTEEVKAPGFKAAEHVMPYLDWFEAPATNNGACMLLISGGGYQNCCDGVWIDWVATNSVKCWEQLRRMGIQSDLHTLVTRGHCFQNKAAPGTGSYTWMGRIWEFMNHKGFNK